MRNSNPKANRIKRIIAKITAATLLASLVILPLGTVDVSAKEDHYLHDVYISVNGGETKTVRAVDCEYRNNLFVSLWDMAALLSGTDAAFSAASVEKEIALTLGGTPEGRNLGGWQEDEKEAFFAKESANNSLTLNGEIRKYSTLRADYGKGIDCFIRPVSLCMMLGMDIEDVSEDTYAIKTGTILKVSPQKLEQDGFFNEINSVLVGDATTGEIYYEFNGQQPLPIASTTKLMTYILTEEAVSKGAITEDTMVTISEEAAIISESEDGTTPMEAGKQISVSELIRGALLPSSNECAYLLGEAVGGDTATFVSMMNDKAAELGLSSAVFNNANGLPNYNDSGVPSKSQNLMNAEDMFKMCAYILKTYPQIKEVTSLKDASLNSINAYVKNTNEILYNMPEINGLKTGTTNRAGCCLVTSLTVNDGASDHDLVVVLLGAENNRARFTISELLAYYAKNVVLGNLSADGVVLSSGDETAEDQPLKITASTLVDMVVREAFKLQKEGFSTNESVQ